ncbi:MAG: DUF2834 domain-containing protein [Acaryochloridaceae cyanobacterium SU_2_1]|nr:DUF2834 domain-containing protein [Acaryochloridaceae cyanobacterium SU_2_1]
MIQKIALGLLWLGFGLYAFLLAPGNQADTLSILQPLMTGDWQRINPLIVALFNLMGIWPMVYGCLLFADGREQRVPAWPFASLSFGIGAFAILPYLAVRQQSVMPQSGQLNPILRVWDSRWLGLGLLVAAIALLGYGLLQGNWAEFWVQWRTNRFIHVMSLDFCLLSLIFPLLLPADLARRGMDLPPLLFLGLVFMPLLGPLIYLCLRLPLETNATLT